MDEVAEYFVHVDLAEGLKAPSNADDEEVEGVYLVTVSASVPLSWHPTLVLDAFHEKIGIDTLDDFEIYITDDQRNPIFEDENRDDPSRPDGHARFEGKLDPDEVMKIKNPV
jgi:hypothetical protein